MKWIILISITLSCSLFNNKEKVTKKQQEIHNIEMTIAESAQQLLDQKKYKEFLKLTLELKNVNIHDQIGDSLLHMAVESGQDFLIEALIKKGANLNVKNKFGYTPTMYSIIQGSTNSLKILLKAGADPNITDAFDMNGLMRAAFHHDLKIIKILIEAKANPFGSMAGREFASKLAVWADIKQILLEYERSYNKTQTNLK